MDRFEGAVAVDLQDVEKMEAAVLWSTRGEAGADHLPDGDGSVPAAKNLLASIQSTNIGISAFGFGLKRCDSAEF